MSLFGLIILVLLAVILVGSFPIYPYSRNWGYFPSGIITLLLVILFIFMLMQII